jgi:hypothetical protein
MDDSVDYSPLQKANSETGLAVEKTFGYLMSFITRGTRMRTAPDEYSSILGPFPVLYGDGLVLKTKELFDSKGKGVYDNYVIKLCLLYSQLGLMGPAGTAIAFVSNHYPVTSTSEYGISLLHRDIVPLLCRLQSSLYEVQGLLAGISAETLSE